MSVLIPILIVAAAAVALVLRQRPNASNSIAGRFSDEIYPTDNSQSLRKTIVVNLSILEPELARLKNIASHAPASENVEKANQHLRAAAETVAAVDLELSFNRNIDLGKTLALVFEAMNRSSEAHKLLGVC